MALAGPAANLSLVLVAGLVIRGGMAAGLFKPPDSISFTQVTASAAGGPAAGAVVPLSLLFSLNLLLFVLTAASAFVTGTLWTDTQLPPPTQAEAIRHGLSFSAALLSIHFAPTVVCWLAFAPLERLVAWWRARHATLEPPVPIASGRMM